MSSGTCWSTGQVPLAVPDVLCVAGYGRAQSGVGCVASGRESRCDQPSRVKPCGMHSLATALGVRNTQTRAQAWDDWQDRCLSQHQVSPAVLRNLTDKENDAEVGNQP